MIITWLGHSAFLIKAEDGRKVLTDPYEAGSYDGAVGYGKIEDVVDVVIVSHEHPDHFDVKSLKGSPTVVKGVGTYKVGGFVFNGVATYHDQSRGRERGGNTIFSFDVDGFRVCHLGDLGHVLSANEVASIGTVDVLFIPVGGFYTINADEAKRVVDQLNPRVVIPMHFKTEVLGFPIAPVDPFLKGQKDVERPGTSEFSITKETLPGERKIVVLEHKL
ncbi:MBL fold metallo-hydrolase [candidate division KSB1 bacterium]|nr:MBL fold metallo-hydrolase [candidate division KSB1 bacterium]